jgi:hypothetical protein
VEGDPGLDVAPFAGVTRDAIAAAAVGFTFGGPAGGLVGGLTPFAIRLAALSQAEFDGGRDRAVAAWEVAAREVGQAPDVLVRRAEANPDRRHLGYSVGEAASQSRYPERIVALGRALSTGLLTEDSAVLDDEQQMVDALAVIERPHLVLLTSLLHIEQLGDGDVSWVPLTLNWEELQERVPELKRSLPRLLATVQREGLVRLDTVSVVAPDSGRPEREYPGAFWRLTPFGLEALARLRQAGLTDLDTHERE